MPFQVNEILSKLIMFPSYLFPRFQPMTSYSFVKALKVEHIEIGRRKRRASLLLVSSDKGTANKSFLVSNEDLARLKLLAPMDESTEENL